MIIAVLSAASVAQVIPDSLRIDWRHAGYPGQLPDPAFILDITALGAVGDSVTPVDPFVTMALDSLQDTFGVIYFPAGKYLVNNPIVLSDHIILRGASSDSTLLKFDFNGGPNDCIDISKGQQHAFTPILSGFTRGSTEITVADASTFSVNEYAEIRQENGAWDTKPAGYAAYSVGQIVKITAINDSLMTIHQPLRLDYDTALSLEIRIIEPAKNVGIECMTITRVDTPSSNSVYNINFQYAVESWVNGIESNKSMGSHVMIEQSAHIEISGSYFHHSFGYDGSGTRGYGVTLRQHAGDCLIENNIFQHLRHAMMVKEGANGNVFAYNYSIEPNRSEPISGFSGDISLHGHYAYANLFEGNVVQNIILDHFWGQSGPYNTLFRNRMELYGIIFTPDSVQTNHQNIVGNVLANTGGLYGQYILTGSGHFEYANNVKGTITPSGTSNLPDSSYYLNTKPDFWNDQIPWPSIGAPNSFNTGTIPAKQRFLSGENLTVCAQLPDSIPDTTTSILPVEPFSLHVHPNPFNDKILIDCHAEKTGLTYITIFDLSGRIIQQKTVLLYNGMNHFEIAVDAGQPEGIYLLQVKNKTSTFTTRIVKLKSH